MVVDVLNGRTDLLARARKYEPGSPLEPGRTESHERGTPLGFSGDRFVGVGGWAWFAEGERVEVGGWFLPR